MRNYLFRGKKIDNGEWIEGSYVYQYGTHMIYLPNGVDREYGFDYYHIVPESVGMYTDMNEFVVTDRSFNKPLFEGDIVEVWSRRRIPTEYIYSPPSSQYDVEVKARAVIRFKYGKWFLDYDNEYNKTLCKLRGNEQMERTVESWDELYHFQCHGKDEDWYRAHNSHYKWSDIVKIGTEFENKDLL